MNLPNSSLVKWFQNVVPPFPKPMVWCHTSDAFSLRDIIKEKKIKPRTCPFFNQDLIYFFYGRPAFRRDAAEASGLHSRAPVVIVLHPHLIKRGARLFPFDTGAFATNRYAKWMHPNMTVENFELECEDAMPPKHVSAFFDTNQNYLDLACKGVHIPHSGEYEVESIIKLLTDQSTPLADDRRLAMELSVSCDIVFDASAIMALIIPDELKQVDWFNQFIKGPGYGIELIEYKNALQRQAIQYQALFEDIATELQKSRGLI